MCFLGLACACPTQGFETKGNAMKRLSNASLMVASVVIALALYACGKKSDDAKPPTESAAHNDPAAAQLAQAPSPTAAAVVPATPQSVTLWHSYRDDERKALDELITHWNGRHPEVQIQALAVPFDAIIDKFQVATQNGNGPDLIIMAHDKIGLWARDGLLQPLGDFATKDLLARFMPQTVKPLVFDKAIWGVPLAFKSVALFYNRKLVKQPPTTLAQLVEVGRGFTSAQAETFGLAYDAADLYFHAAFLYGSGGKVWDEDARKVTIDTPEALKAVELVRGFFTESKILPKGASGFVVTAMFNDGKTPFTIQGPWFISEIDKGVDWAVAVLPEIAPGQPMRPFLGSEALLLAKPSKVRAAALQVVDYLTSDEAALTRLEKGHQMVANAKIYENPRWIQDPVVRVFHAQAKDAVPMPTAPEPSVAWAPYGTALRKVIFGGADPKATLAEAQKTADEAVARLGK